MKRKIAFILMMSLLSANTVLAEDNEQVNISLTFDSDMFLKTTANATKSYNDGLWYYDGSKYEGTVTLGGMTYKLDGDMNTKGDDVIKIDASDVTVNLNNSASRSIGLIMFSREEQQNNEVTVTVNYKGGKSDDYVIDVPAMTDENDEGVGFNPLIVEKKGMQYKAAVDTSDLVYLNDVVIDTSKSVNKNLDVESITLSDAEFVYYVAAVNQVKFSESELEEQTKEAVRNLYTKYESLNFVDLFEEKDGVNINEAQELYSAMLKQEGKMDVATAENIERIENLIKSYELYVEIKGYKEGIEGLLGDYPEKSADFTDLSETDLTDSDFENFKELLETYEKVKEFDGESFEGYVEMYGLKDSIDISINMENESKIKALHDAYEKASKKAELKEKIDGIYPIYIGKDISEITENDLENLAELIGYFDEAEEFGIDFSEYNKRYICHIYEDYEVFKTSEDKKAIDITGFYNVDVLGVKGDIADAKVWYECADNLAGERFVSAGHTGIKSYDKKTEVLYLKEYEFVETSTFDPATEITTVTYPFTETGDAIPFYMPEKVFRTTVCDGLLLKASGKDTYTFNMSGRYTDKLYFTISSKGQGNIIPTVTYSDGTKESYKIYVNTTGQTVNETRNKRKTYPDMVNFITSGNYKDQSMAVTGVLYEPEGNTTNGFSTFAAKLNPEKVPVSVTFVSSGFDYVLFGVAENPVENNVITDRTEKLYSEVVKDGVADTTDISKVSELVLNYNEAVSRGLYFEGIDEEIIAELSEMVLTASGEAYRQDKDTVKAEIEFSVPVTKSELGENIKVLYGDDEVTDYTYEADSEGKKLSINIPVNRFGGNELKIKVLKNLTIADYPAIGMVSDFDISYNVPEYLTTAYSSNSLKITNNSKTAQDYLVYATVVDNGEIKGVVTAEGTIDGSETKNVGLDTYIYDTESSVKNIAVLDKNTFAPLFEVTEVEKTIAETNKNADFTKPSLNLEKDVIKIEGITLSEKEDKVMSAMVYSPVGEIIYAGVIKTNKDGYFAVKIPLLTEKIPVSGYLTIKIGGDDFEDAYIIDDLYYPVEGDRVNIVNDLKNASSVSDIEELLKEAEEKLSLNFTPFNELKKSEVSLNALAERMEKIKSDIPAISESDSETVKKEKISEVQKIIKQQSVLECIKEGKRELVANEGELLYDDIMFWSSIDKDGVTLYSLYKNKISEDGKKAIIDGLMKKNYKTTDELYDALKELIMLNALKNPKEGGVGHVEAALTKENADATDMTITKYLNLKDKSKANSDIANMTISALSDVENYIRKLSDTNIVNKPSNGSSGGGGGSMGGISIVPSTEKITDKENVEEKPTFNDVDKNHWAYEAIENLTKKGILNGKGNGKFDPNGTITRAEFVKILCVAKDIKAEGPISFKDVERYSWYEEYVAAAFNAGLVNGISETEFGVNNPIQRQDICTILYRTKGVEEKNSLGFKDSVEISDYAKDAVAFFAVHGIVNGFSDGTFRPAERCTRAQAAKIIYNYLSM